jgi:hypothetical protein
VLHFSVIKWVTFRLTNIPVLRNLAQVLPLTYFVSGLRGAMLNAGGPAAPR